MKYDDEKLEFSNYLRQLIDSGRLEGAALGITKLVIDKGTDDLSEKQRYVFEKEVHGQYVLENCKICGEKIPWSEMFNAATDHGMCNLCWHRSTKDD